MLAGHTLVQYLLQHTFFYNSGLLSLLFTAYCTKGISLYVKEHINYGNSQISPWDTLDKK